MAAAEGNHLGGGRFGGAVVVGCVLAPTVAVVKPSFDVYARFREGEAAKLPLSRLLKTFAPHGR